MSCFFGIDAAHFLQITSAGRKSNIACEEPTGRQSLRREAAASFLLPILSALFHRLPVTASLGTIRKIFGFFDALPTCLSAFGTDL